MSPEQLRGKTIDARSDIFSLGVTLYECATGITAFERGTPLEVSLRVVADTPPPPSELNPAVPPGLDRIIARAMAKNPAGRYESAESLRSDLLELRQDIEGSAAVSRPVSTASSTPNENRRSFRFKALIAAAAVAALLAVWFAPGLFRRGQHVPPPEAVVWYNRGTSAIREGAYFQASKASGARARDRQLFRAGARSAGGSLRGDRTHRQSQGGTAAGDGAAPGSLESVRRRVNVSGRRRGNAEPQLQDGD